MRCVATAVVFALAAALLGGTAQQADAQEADEDLRLDTVAEEEVPPPPSPPQITIGDDDILLRPRAREAVDPYAPIGLRAGAFTLFPSLEAGSVVSSNVRRTLTDKKADVGLSVRPKLRLESDWVRHQLTANAEFEGRQFLGEEDIKSIGGNIDAGLRLDVRRTTTADIEWNYEATSTGLESGDLPTDATGSRLDQQFGASAAVTHDFGGVEGRLRLGVSRELFGDVDLAGGLTEDNSDRDYTELSLSARGSLKTGAILEPFGEIAYVPRIHDQKIDRNGLKRDSQGLRLSAGVTFNDEPVWAGEVAAVMELRDYSDSTLNTALVPGVAASLTWRPTDLTQFEFSAGASLSETVSAGSSATQDWNVGYQMTHALQENLELQAGMNLEFSREEGETDITYVGNLGLNWTINPNVVLSAGYEGTFFRGAGPSDDYTDHRLLTSIILRH
jgi:hypothetical protein